MKRFIIGLLACSLLALTAAFIATDVTLFDGKVSFQLRSGLRLATVAEIAEMQQQGGGNAAAPDAAYVSDDLDVRVACALKPLPMQVTDDQLMQLRPTLVNKLKQDIEDARIIKNEERTLSNGKKVIYLELEGTKNGRTTVNTIIIATLGGNLVTLKYGVSKAGYNAEKRHMAAWAESTRIAV